MTLYQQKLINILESLNFRSEFNTLETNDKKLVNDTSIIEVYNQLGGIQNSFPRKFNDVITTETFICILDEDKHFNNYRFQTLLDPTYQNIQAFNLESYKRFCRNHLTDCLKAASAKDLWHNKISEQYFGQSNDNGDCSLKGSSQWKMQAFEDFLTDTYLMHQKIPFLRISIFENIMTGGQLKPMKSLLLSNTNTEVVKKYIERKIINLNK